MFPQHTFAGYTECEVLPDGKIKYSMFFVPSGGKASFIADPSNEEEMLGVQHLNLVPIK